MAQLQRCDPPALTNPAYSAFRSWLDYDYFWLTCAYCGLPDPGAEIDHYEPRHYAPTRLDDPTNLVLSCSKCNGRGGKHDYHPLHKKRSRLSKDTSGFYVVDARKENPATLFKIEDDGTVSARPGSSEDRAIRNIALLRLDLHQRPVRRKELLDIRDACERLVSARDRGDQTASVVLDQLLPFLARRLLFFNLYDLEIATNLKDELVSRYSAFRTDECEFQPQPLPSEQESDTGAEEATKPSELTRRSP